MPEQTAESVIKRARAIHIDTLDVSLLGAWRDGDEAGYEPSDRPVITDALLAALLADGYSEVKIGIWRPWRGQLPGARRLADETIRVPISELLPPRIDTLADLQRAVTRDSDRFGVGLASDAEIASLTADTIADVPVWTVDRWHLVAFRGLEDGRPVTSTRCLGYRYGDVWITSDVAEISRDRSTLRTRSRAYWLGDPGGSEVPRDLVRLLARAMVSWGMLEFDFE